MALNSALPAWKMLVSASLLAMLGNSQSLLFVPQINTVLLDAPMLPTWWIKILTYLQLERFLIIFYNLVFKLLIIVKAVVLNSYVHVLCSF
jgi:hypothetical protein